MTEVYACSTASCVNNLPPPDQEWQDFWECFANNYNTINAAMSNGTVFDSELYSSETNNLLHGNGESLNDSFGTGGIAAI